MALTWWEGRKLDKEYDYHTNLWRWISAHYDMKPHEVYNYVESVMQDYGFCVRTIGRGRLFI